MVEKGIGEYQIRKTRTSTTKILEFLNDGKFHRYEEIKKHTNLSSSTLSKRLKQLEKIGLIEKKIDLESGKYPYPVYYRINPFIAYITTEIAFEPLSTYEWKSPRIDIHYLNELCGDLILDILNLYFKSPERNEEIFNAIIELYVSAFYQKSIHAIKKELERLMVEGVDVPALLKEEKEEWKKDYEFLIKRFSPSAQERG